LTSADRFRHRRTKKNRITKPAQLFGCVARGDPVDVDTEDD
jgi:hypothetical protein